MAKISNKICKKYAKNVLICDERGEIAVGKAWWHCDVLRYATKDIAFDAGIRAMRPDVIITDELSLQDCTVVQRAISAGVYVVASAHFLKFDAVSAPFQDIFDRYVFLDSQEIGKVHGVYDKRGKEVVCYD